MKAFSTCYEIWHPGSHMILESVFFQKGNALRLTSSCMLRTGDLQTLIMQMHVLHSPLVKHCVQIGLQVTPTVVPFGNKQPPIGRKVLFFPQVMQLLAISILPLGPSVERRGWGSGEIACLWAGI